MDDLCERSALLRDLIDRTFDHVFDEELPVAELADGATLGSVLFTAAVQLVSGGA